MVLNGPLQYRDHLGGNRHRRRLVILRAGQAEPGPSAARAARDAPQRGPGGQPLPWWDSDAAPFGDEVGGPNHWEGALCGAVAPWSDGAATPPSEQQWDPDAYLTGPYFDGVWE